MAFGVTCALIALYFLPHSAVQNMVLFVVAAFVAATIPDLDLTIPFMKHRGISHSLVGLATVTIICTAIAVYLRDNTAMWFFAGFPIGYFSHLVSDSFTEHRVAWLRPFDNKPYGIPIFNTSNKLIQGIMVVGLWIFNASVFYLLAKA